MVAYHRPPKTVEWVGLIVMLGGILVTLATHLVASTRAWDAVVDRQDRMAVELCILAPPAQKSDCEKRMEVRHYAN